VCRHQRSAGGQEVKFDKGIDPRSGKAAVATIEIA
jgi:hypothetical protein